MLIVDSWAYIFHGGGGGGEGTNFFKVPAYSYKKPIELVIFRGGGG